MKSKMNVYTCDACRTRILPDEEGLLAKGYHGKVCYIHDMGGSANLAWYACQEKCIVKAINAVLEAQP